MSERICLIDGCGKPRYGHGLCVAHWERVRRHGRPDAAYPDPIPTFFAKVREGANGCWEWTGQRDRRNYGKWYGKDRPSTLAHRCAYTWLVGEIPEDLTLDHLCRNPPCVNPWHLDPVPQAVNMARAKGLKTHCKHGHPFDDANTIRSLDGSRRRCRTCHEADRRRREARHRQVA